MLSEVKQPEPAMQETASTGGESAEGAFLARLHQVFDRLRAGGVPFCILRNRDRIPWSLVTGSDVDVIVPGGTSASRLIALMQDLSPAQIVPHKATLEMYFPVGSLYLHVDFLIANRQWRGAVYLKNTEILADVQDDDGLPVASQLHQAFCAWFSSLTRKRMFKERYIPLISAATAKGREEFAKLLRRVFGEQLGERLMKLAEQNELDHSNSFAGACRKTVWKRAFAKSPMSTIGGLLGYYASELKLYFRPTGLTVAVLGPDGAGKSTVCSILAQMNRAQLPFSAIETQHMYQRALPRLSELKKGRIRTKPLTSAATHDPHGKKPHSLPASVFSLFYTAIDQWCSRLRWSKLKMSRNMLMLHDRHMLEVVVDPKRFRYAGPSWLAKAFMQLIPTPDLIVLLDTPAEILQSRKQEVPFEETRRQRDAFKALVSSMPCGRVVNATGPAEEVAADVREVILSHMADRTRRRAGKVVRPGKECGR
jgi:thymidylate kinase